MAQTPLTRIVRSQAKGRITIPIEFRKRLGIGQNAFLRLTLRGSRIEISPAQLGREGTVLRNFNQKELDGFLEQDKIDARMTAKIRRFVQKA